MENDCDAKQDQQEGVAADEEKYLNQLIDERQKLDPSLTLSAQLLDREIAQLKAKQESGHYIELHQDKQTKMCVKVRVPVKEFPKFNFVGKILGPKGNSLKRVQEETGTRMAVFGRGSMRDKQKEEELRKEGGKYAHLNEDLHVSVEVVAHPMECYRRLWHAMFILRQHLVPDYNDGISQSQVQELKYLNGETSSLATHGRGGGGGAPPVVRGHGIYRGSYAPFGRVGSAGGGFRPHPGGGGGWSPRSAATVPPPPPPAQPPVAANSSSVYSDPRQM